MTTFVTIMLVWLLSIWALWHLEGKRIYKKIKERDPAHREEYYQYLSQRASKELVEDERRVDRQLRQSMMFVMATDILAAPYLVVYLLIAKLIDWAASKQA